MFEVGAFVMCVCVSVSQKEKQRERETEKEKRRKKKKKERVSSSSRRECGFERMGGPSCELERSASLTESVCMWHRNDTKGRKWGGGIRGKQTRVLKSTLRKPSLLLL